MKITATSFLLTLLADPVMSFQNTHAMNNSLAVQRGSNTNLYMAKSPPVINNWMISSKGEVFGVVTNHPSISNGENITTSSLKAEFLNESSKLKNGTVVTTKSGSQYKLGRISNAFQQELLKKQKKAKETEQQTKDDENDTQSVNLFSFFGSNSKKSAATTTDTAKKDISTLKPQPKKQTVASKKEEKNPKVLVTKSLFSGKAERQSTESSLNLNGKSIGNGKYLLAGKPQITTSGKSVIYLGYEADTNTGMAIKEKQVTIKLSKQYESIERENRNYDKVTSGIFKGSFVKKLDFLIYAEGKGFENDSALIIEKGQKDLKLFLVERGYRGLEGKALRDAAAAAGQCIQAMHSSNMVWTDLKAENFVVLNNVSGDNGLPGVKGIDLESAMPYNDTPVDYSPEACPPEFADAYLKGEGPDFILGPSYDIWSLGMLLYELSTGRPYFAGASPTKITKTLRKPDFEPDVSKIQDPKLRDLVSQCLQRDPKKRIDIVQFLLHPYFLTTGIGPISF